MCFFGGGAKAAPAPKKAEFEDAPPVVTGKQTGVDNPKDTAKATDKLRMDRKKREGTYVDPTVNTNLDRTTSLLTKSGGGMGAVERNERAKKLKSGYSRGNPTKAQRMAKARQNAKGK